MRRALAVLVVGHVAVAIAAAGHVVVAVVVAMMRSSEVVCLEPAAAFLLRRLDALAVGIVTIAVAAVDVVVGHSI